MRTTWLTLLLLASGSALAAPASDPAALFPGSTKLELKNEGVRVWYPADKATPIKTPPAYLKDYEEAGVYGAQPLVLDLGHGLPPLALACDSGPSADPSCRLLPKHDDPASQIFESYGLDFVFLASGDVYVYGHTDNLYDHRRLYRYDGKRFAEVKQPMRYVGVEAKAKKPIALSAARGGKSVSLTLPAGAEFTVLLNDNATVDDNDQNADYLVMTREGVVGWARLPQHPDGQTDAEGLFYSGD